MKQNTFVFIHIRHIKVYFVSGNFSKTEYNTVIVIIKLLQKVIMKVSLAMPISALVFALQFFLKISKQFTIAIVLGIFIAVKTVWCFQSMMYNKGIV